MDKLRTLSLTYGFIVLTIVLVGVSPDKINIGIISGSLSRPEYLFSSLSLIFIYYYSYYLIFEKELGRYKLHKSNKVHFIISIVEFLIEVEIKKKLNSFNLNHNYVSISSPIPGNEELNLDINLEGQLTADFLAETFKDSGLEINGSRLKVNYKLTPQDLSYYKNHREYAESINKIDILEYFVPKWLGVIFLLIVIVSAIMQI